MSSFLGTTQTENDHGDGLLKHFRWLDFHFSFMNVRVIIHFYVYEFCVICANGMFAVGRINCLLRENRPKNDVHVEVG